MSRAFTKLLQSEEATGNSLCHLFCSLSDLCLAVPFRSPPSVSQTYSSGLLYRADTIRAINHSRGFAPSGEQSTAKERHGKIGTGSKGGYNRFYVEIPVRNRKQQKHSRKSCADFPAVLFAVRFVLSTSRTRWQRPCRRRCRGWQDPSWRRRAWPSRAKG